MADLPNAFPLFLAIERILAVDIQRPVALAALCGYTTVYVLPTAVLLVLGARQGPRVRATMQRITDRFLSGVARRSIPIATALTIAGLASAALVALV